MRHDPARIEGLLSLRRPETGGELQHFLAAVNWMHTHLPELAKMNAPLRGLMETLLQNGVPSASPQPRKITSAKSTTDRQQAWVRVKHLLGECVTPAQPCAEHTVMVFTDTSDLRWGAMVMQVPDADLCVVGRPYVLNATRSVCFREWIIYELQITLGYPG